MPKITATLLDDIDKITKVYEKNSWDEVYERSKYFIT